MFVKFSYTTCKYFLKIKQKEVDDLNIFSAKVCLEQIYG